MNAAQDEAPRNRLAREASPYLLQHAHNPVDWYPWGREAFEEARRRQAPIFLSVGYSTCYWCHVMERESFEDEGIARRLNENFVCIKVDREERPDVDDIYMAAVQLMTQRGGWPMSVWLTPPGARGEGDRGLEPFYAGTYFPAEPRHGMTSFPEVLSGIAQAWKDQRPAVLEQAARVTDAVREQIVRASAEKPIGARQVGQAVATLLRIHDPNLGGFGGAPKFPQPVFLEFLLETHPAFDDPAVAATVKCSLRLTLDRMALGGMFDQVGGGFHRYSTDERWLVPHFEKMLYDQGQLASTYARAYREWDDEFDAHILRRVCDYVLREMTSPGGAFYSAQDAEVNHREGWNYLWTREQLIDALGKDDGEFAAKVYGVDAGPNFRDPHDKFALPSNVLFLADRPEQTAEQMGMAPAEFAARLSRVNERLYSARAKRDQPALDDKVIVAWNGLMIAGLADAAAALKEPKYLDAARRASAFILRDMRVQSAPEAPARENEPRAQARGASEPEAPARDFALLRIWRRGAAGTPAFLEDYAMLMRGLLACHRAGVALGRIDDAEIETARLLWESARRRFEDRDRPGLLHDTLPDQSDLIVRAATTYDGAMPSGASVMLNNLIDLYELTGERDSLREASRVLAALSAAVAESPIAAVNSTRALSRLLRIDPAPVESIGGGAPAEEVVRLPDAPVQVFASAERVVVPRTGPADLVLELRIREGFHITAHEPGVEGLSPLLVEVRGGSGVRTRIAYPPGTPYTGEALPPEDRGRMMVHEGALRLRVALERTGEAWAGRPMLVVTYQACDDRACFQPMTVELDVALDEEREGAAR